MSTAREVVRLFDEGKTPPQIASILDLPYEDVHRFLESRRALLADPHVGVARDLFRKLADEQRAAGDGGVIKPLHLLISVEVL
ncbi:MAG TPA: hypothetical protein VIG47_09670 [Gemmatimonadaceae bacterium]|jgi:hypothetical protein